MKSKFLTIIEEKYRYRQGMVRMGVVSQDYNLQKYCDILQDIWQEINLSGRTGEQGEVFRMGWLSPSFRMLGFVCTEVLPCSR